MHNYHFSQKYAASYTQRIFNLEIFYNIAFITDLHTFTTHRNDNIHCLENKKKLLHSTGICLITVYK